MADLVVLWKAYPNDVNIRAEILSAWIQLCRNHDFLWTSL